LKDENIKVAIKVIDKSKLSLEDLESLKNEVLIMQTVDHPNIVKYFETYDDKKFIYLVMELCTGGELFQHIVRNSKLMPELEIRHIMIKLLRAL